MLYASVFIPTCAPNVLIYFRFGEAKVSSNCARPAGRRQGVSRVIYLPPLVMHSHYPRDSMGFLLSFILTFFSITVTPSLFSFHTSAPYLFPLPSSISAALEIHCGIDRKTSPVSLTLSLSKYWEGCISRISGLQYIAWAGVCPCLYFKA